METETRVRECPICPPWVIACAHFGEALVILSSPEGRPTCVCERFQGEWRLIEAPCASTPCPKEGCSIPGWAWQPGLKMTRHLNFGSAIEAFHEAEISLLRGDNYAPV